MNAYEQAATTCSMSQVTLGQALRRRRKLLGLPQREVAKLFGTSQPVFSTWEKDLSKPADVPAAIPVLAAFLEVSEAEAADLLVDRRDDGTEQLRQELAELWRVVADLQRRVGQATPESEAQ